MYCGTTIARITNNAVKLNKNFPFLLERVGVRRIKKRKSAFKFPHILAFSLKGEGTIPLTY
jgi:hypothetical protein